MAICIHPNMISAASNRGLSWEVRLEFRGPNPKNNWKHSAKYWSVETIPGDAYWLIVRWGKIGTAGQGHRKPYSAALGTMYEKIREGYSPVTEFRTLPSISPKLEEALPEPYCRIATIVLGERAEIFRALDKEERLVMNLTRNGVSKIFEKASHIRDASPGVIL